MGQAQERYDVAGALTTTPAEVERLTGSILWDIFTAGPFLVPLDGEEPFLSADERSHMTDVSGLARALALVDALALAVAVWAFRALRRERGRRGMALIAGAAGVGGLAAVLAITSVVAFEPLFIAFHQVFFPGGNWAFPPGSNLTTLFPEALFADAAVLSGILVVLTAAAVVLLGVRDLRATDRC